MLRSTSLLALTGCILSSPVSATEESRPNILFILVDDLGYADLGCQGSKEIRTPHIDGLAASGLRFTDAYVTAPQCGQGHRGHSMCWDAAQDESMSCATPFLPLATAVAGFQTASVWPSVRCGAKQCRAIVLNCSEVDRGAGERRNDWGQSFYS